MLREIGAGCIVDTIVRLPQGETEAIASVPDEAKATLPLSATIAELRELQAQRRFCIKSQSRCDRSIEAFIARSMGYVSDQDEKARAEVWKRAASFRREVEKNGGGQSSRADNSGQGPDAPAVPLILLSAQARQSWDSHRAAVEKRMRKAVRSLPVWGWAVSVRGLGELGVGIIVGESGDLANYATVERLWKRLGLAVIDGARQQKRVNSEEAAAHGYNPARRAEVWTIGDSLLRAQWRGEKDGEPAHALGPYGEVYARRKAATEGREGWSKARRDADARRIMTKELVRGLWGAWRSGE